MKSKKLPKLSFAQMEQEFVLLNRFERKDVLGGTGSPPQTDCFFQALYSISQGYSGIFGNSSVSDFQNAYNSYLNNPNASSNGASSFQQESFLCALSSSPAAQFSFNSYVTSSSN